MARVLIPFLMIVTPVAVGLGILVPEQPLSMGLTGAFSMLVAGVILYLEGWRL